MLLIGAILLAVFVLPRQWGVVAVAAAAAVEVAEIFFWVWLSRRSRVRFGPETLIGAAATVVTACRPYGQVRVEGELWTAHCPAGAEVGDAVRVRALQGLTLVVEREEGN